MADRRAHSLRRIAVRLVKAPYLPGLLLVVAIFSALFYADFVRKKSAETMARTKVHEELNLIRSKLEGKINGNILLAQGLAAAVATEPDMPGESFDRLAGHLMQSGTQIRSIALAPNLVVNHVYPLKGNEKALGLDYRKNDDQRSAVYRARDENRVTLAGPVNLVQGGQGLLVRYPVNVTDPDGKTTFWGVLSAVIDLDKLYRESGLDAAAKNLHITVGAINHDNGSIRYFYGSRAEAGRMPTAAAIDLGYEQWIMLASPKEGWDVLPEGTATFRLTLALVGLLIILPLLWIGRLMRERHENVLALRNREEQLEELSQRLGVALETSQIGVWDYDVDEDILIWDERMRDIYGMSRGQVNNIYEDWERSLHPEDLPIAKATFAETIATGRKYITQFRIITETGEVRHIRAYGTAYRDRRGHYKIVGVNWNVTEDIRLQDELKAAKKKADEQNRELEIARKRMEYNSLHDALTGLPNRRFLDQILAERDAGAKAPGMTLLHIDLDRFKDINDTLGHGAGDRILKHTADTLLANVGVTEFVARIGGDEFVVITGGNGGPEDSSQLAEKLIEGISRPVDYNGHECRVGASIGVASRTDFSEKADDLLINADIALYEAKRRGRNRVEFFSDELRAVAVSNKRTADEILRGLEHGEFIPYFQPQFDARTLEIAGVEALARWEHPEKGMLPPSAFLPIAEALNNVAQIDASILHQALFQYHRWQAAGLAIPQVSVNISAQRLLDDGLIEKLREIAPAPGSLSFELLESISFDDEDDMLLSRIKAIKELGIAIELDDFGTGYASIISLINLSPRRLKIDRQLIKPVLSGESQKQLVRSIIDIGRSRGIESVAEGIETMEHASLLRDLGCDLLQGFALARPMSADQFLAFAKAYKPATSRRRRSA
ncbi:bifunctional diguanylate cyclase/phosphodiesterase [Rhizobium sp. PAMB 3182]